MRGGTCFGLLTLQMLSLQCVSLAHSFPSSHLQYNTIANVRKERERVDIGRSISFSPDEIDVEPPRIIGEMEFDHNVPYRSSNFHWASRLIYVGGKIMTSIYTLKPGISLAARQAAVPELHLMLESW